MKRRFVPLTTAALLLLWLPQRILAAQPWNGLEDTDVATIQSLETLFSNVVKSIVSLAGVGLFIMLLVGGFNFLFSGGDQKKLAQAQGTITNAIAGLIVIVSGYLILRIITAFTGVDVTKFTIPN